MGCNIGPTKLTISVHKALKKSPAAPHTILMFSHIDVIVALIDVHTAIATVLMPSHNAAIKSLNPKKFVFHANTAAPIANVIPPIIKPIGLNAAPNTVAKTVAPAEASAIAPDINNTAPPIVDKVVPIKVNAGLNKLSDVNAPTIVTKVSGFIPAILSAIPATTGNAFSPTSIKLSFNLLNATCNL